MQPKKRQKVCASRKFKSLKARARDQNLRGLSPCDTPVDTDAQQVHSIAPASGSQRAL